MWTDGESAVLRADLSESVSLRAPISASVWELRRDGVADTDSQGGLFPRGGGQPLDSLYASSGGAEGSSSAISLGISRWTVSHSSSTSTSK